MTKVEHAQAILKSFAPEVSLEVCRNGYFFSWEMSGQKYRRRWQARGDSDYPVWYHDRPFGGTGCVALACLVKWLRGVRRLNVCWWSYVCGPEVRLSYQAASTVALVRAAIAEHGDS